MKRSFLALVYTALVGLANPGAADPATAEALRDGDIHVVAPFRYASLVWAIILGIVLFGEWPDALTLIGAGIIVATGLYTLHREMVVAKRAASANISAASPPPARGT